MNLSGSAFGRVPGVVSPWRRRNSATMRCPRSATSDMVRVTTAGSGRRKAGASSLSFPASGLAAGLSVAAGAWVTPGGRGVPARSGVTLLTGPGPAGAAAGRAAGSSFGASASGALAAASATGEDLVELHLHGGRAVVAAVATG